MARAYKPLASIGAAALLMVLLTGCGTVTAGSAAVVGSRRISVSDVQSATADAQTWVGGGLQVTPAQVLYLLALAPHVQEIAGRYGAGASADEARKTLQVRVPKPAPSAVTLMRVNLSLTNLQERLGESQTAQLLNEATKRLLATRFTVNPRFGSFNFNPRTGSGQIIPLQPNWLVSAEADPGATLSR